LSDRYYEFTVKDANSYQVPETARSYLKDKIAAMSKKLNVTSKVYKEILRSLLSEIRLGYINDDSEYVSLKLHHGRQERAVSKKFQENNIILPYSTIFQSGVQSDDSKRRNRDILFYDSTWDDDAQRAERVVSLCVVPMISEYTLSVWAKYVSDLDQIAATFRRQFNPDLILETPYANNVKAFLSDESDISAVEVGDKEDRLIRKTFTINVESYIQSPKFKITSTGKIIQTNTEIWI
jgi:hypothetical protein